MVGVLKVCSKCLKEKPLDKFAKRKISKDGYRNQCKECCNEMTRDSLNNDFELRLNKRKSHDLWAGKNKDHVRYYSKIYYQENKTQLQEINKIRSRQHYADNKDKYKENQKNWKIKNPYKTAFYVACRHALKKQATPLWAKKKEIEKFYILAKLLSKKNGEIYEVDHIIPLQNKLVCGLHVEQNLQVITRTENRHKINTFNFQFKKLNITDRGLVWI